MIFGNSPKTHGSLNCTESSEVLDRRRVKVSKIESREVEVRDTWSKRLQRWSEGNMVRGRMDIGNRVPSIRRSLRNSDMTDVVRTRVCVK